MTEPRDGQFNGGTGDGLPRYQPTNHPEDRPNFGHAQEGNAGYSNAGYGNAGYGNGGYGDPARATAESTSATLSAGVLRQRFPIGSCGSWARWPSELSLG